MTPDAPRTRTGPHPPAGSLEAAGAAQRRLRRRLGVGLLGLSALLTVWSLWNQAPAPLPIAPFTDAACGPHAPSDAVPVSLPVEHSAQWAALDGAVVCFTHALTITEVYDLGRFGELLLADQRLYAPGTGLELADPQLHVVRLGGRERPDTPGVWPLPWGLEIGSVRVGDAVLELVGVVRGGANGEARIEPLGAPSFEVRNPRPLAAPQPAGDLRVAAFNLENYFVTLGQRGAAHPAALVRQTETLVAALAALDADVIAVMEVERDPDGSALMTLASALNAHLEAAVGASVLPPRRYQALPEASTSAVRAGDAIRQGFLIDTERVQVERLTADLASVHERAPQALTLVHTQSGERVSVVAVHLRSKAGCPSSGDVDVGFGCWNLRRQQQAEALLAFAQRLEREQGTGVLLLGDFNTHRYEPPLGVFPADEGWLVVADLMPPEAAVSYVYFGFSAALDHALASPRLASAVAGAAYWAINADEPPAAGPGRGAAAPPGFRADPFRSSDHDPLVVGLRLGAADDVADPIDEPGPGSAIDAAPAALSRSAGAGAPAPRRRGGGPRSRRRRDRRSGSGTNAQLSPAPRRAASRSRAAARSSCTGHSTSASPPSRRSVSAAA